MRHRLFSEDDGPVLMVHAVGNRFNLLSERILNRLRGELNIHVGPNVTFSEATDDPDVSIWNVDSLSA